MNWKIESVPLDQVTPDYLYELSERHRMTHYNPAIAASNFVNMCGHCVIFKITDDGNEVAHIVVSNIVKGEEADVDFIPIPRYFKPEDNYESELRRLLNPILAFLLKEWKLRRLNSDVLKSRHRTVSALKSCGFRKEGVKRSGIRLKNGDVENLVRMGLLPPKE